MAKMIRSAFCACVFSTLSSCASGAAQNSLLVLKASAAAAVGAVTAERRSIEPSLGDVSYNFGPSCANQAKVQGLRFLAPLHRVAPGTISSADSSASGKRGRSPSADSTASGKRARTSSADTSPFPADTTSFPADTTNSSEYETSFSEDATPSLSDAMMMVRMTEDHLQTLRASHPPAAEADAELVSFLRHLLRRDPDAEPPKICLERLAIAVGKSLAIDPGWWKLAGSLCWDDKLFVEAAVAQYPGHIADASKKLIEDRDFVLSLVARNASVLYSLSSSKFWGDTDIFISAFSQDRKLAFNWFSLWLKDEVFVEAVAAKIPNPFERFDFLQEVSRGSLRRKLASIWTGTPRLTVDETVDAMMPRRDVSV